MTSYGPVAQEAAYLSELTGLNPVTAQAWLLNEGQDDSIATPSNPLNIVVRGGGSGTGTETGHNGPLFTYADWQAGIRAAAHLVNSSSHYAGIREAIASGDAIKQAQAIERSPWAGGGYGTRHKGGKGHVTTTTERLLGLTGAVDSGAHVAQTSSRPTTSLSGADHASPWSVNDLVHAVVTYGQLPAATRTERQQRALELDFATLTRDLGSDSAARDAVNAHAGYALLPTVSPALVRPSVAPALGAPANIVPPLVSPVVAPAPAPKAGPAFDPLGLAVVGLALAGIAALVLLPSGEGTE